ncbi:MAG: CDP-glycerol glycerophosphotransferase family protein [Mogibacterium sp.]|nr:CDP-glycerol glycerophosphotransferase family protein [Mogibacterium sp.]
MKAKRKRVSIISRESDSRTLDVAMLEDELLRRCCGVRVLSKLLTKDKSIKALGYAGHILKQEAAILASDVVVLDTYIIPASMLPHLRKTKVVQMWHALGAIKKFGWQTVGKEGGSSEKTAKLMKMHNGYDYVVCASDITAEHFIEAFKTDRNRIVKYGLPRIDYIKSVASGDRHEETLGRILKIYPQLKNDKKTILYAPTFRRGKAVDVQKLIDALGPDKYNIVVKLHPLYRGKADRTPGEFDTVIFDEVFSSNDWLAKADIIISDYSSFVIESSLADKPLYIYAYDLEDYEANTGLNIDFASEPIAPYVFDDADSLAKAVSKGNFDLEALRAFRDRYIDIPTDNCTAVLADFILSLAEHR